MKDTLDEQDIKEMQHEIFLRIEYVFVSKMQFVKRNIHKF